MRLIQGILLLVFLGAVAIFAAQNTSVISVKFVNWGVTEPVALLVVVVYLLGMMSGWTVVAFVSRSLRRVSSREQG